MVSPRTVAASPRTTMASPRTTMASPRTTMASPRTAKKYLLIVTEDSHVEHHEFSSLREMRAWILGNGTCLHPDDDWEEEVKNQWQAEVAAIPDEKLIRWLQEEYANNRQCAIVIYGTLTDQIYY